VRLTSKKFYKPKNFKCVPISSLVASVIVELLSVLCFFHKIKVSKHIQDLVTENVGLIYPNWLEVSN
jgi:hypothetical protein